MKMKNFKIFSVLIAISFVLPVFSVVAMKPIVNDDVWFVAAIISPPTSEGETWWTGDNTILHKRGQTRPWGIFRSPQGSPPGSILIGSMTTTVETFVFNTKTSKGRLIQKVMISFTEPDSVLNPYGVGTLEGTLVMDVTGLHPIMESPGYGMGFVLAMHGTGAFEKTKLIANVLMEPSIGTPMPGKFIFFGTHWNVNGIGTIVYH